MSGVEDSLKALASMQKRRQKGPRDDFKKPMFSKHKRADAHMDAQRPTACTGPTQALARQNPSTEEGRWGLKSHP